MFWRIGLGSVLGFVALGCFVLLYEKVVLDMTIGKFRREMEKLLTRRDLVLKKYNKTEKASDVVLEWLEEGKKLIDEAKKETEIGITSSNEEKIPWYKKMQMKAIWLNTKYNEFEPYSNSGNMELFSSTKDTLDLLQEALHDDKSYIVGLHGMPGSGKTKLVKFVIENKARFLKTFDIVVFATVSQYPKVIDRIQREFEECLNLQEWERAWCCEVARANKIFSELRRSKKKSLVIMDDVRTKLELRSIGIPLLSKRCKVLFTTPSLKVCESMECDRVIDMIPLYEEEAWMWFKEHAQIDDDDDNMLKIAREVVVECNKLPMRLKEVGSSLKRKQIEKWEESLDHLRHLNSISTAQYNIFLSFRGEDTRYTFTGSLCHALHQAGFKVFMDDGGLRTGSQISKSLIEAIQQSRLCIVVFSENYAYSPWCLSELVTIHECMKSKNQLVWPIFYKVDPSDVRRQKNSYGEAMEVHEKRFQAVPEKVQKWRSTLSEVADLSGEHFTTGYEYEFIHKIVKKAENIKDQLRLQN